MAHPDALKVRRAFGALFWGAVLGAFLTAIAIVFPPYALDPGALKPLSLFVIFGRVFLSAFAAWIAGLLLVGAPLWASLHAAGRTGYGSAAMLGFILCFLIPAVPIALSPLLLDEFPQILLPALVFGAIGAIVGLYIRFLAYGRG